MSAFLSSPVGLVGGAAGAGMPETMEAGIALGAFVAGGELAVLTVRACVVPGPEARCFTRGEARLAGAPLAAENPAVRTLDGRPAARAGRAADRVRLRGPIKKPLRPIAAVDISARLEQIPPSVESIPWT